MICAAPAVADTVPSSPFATPENQRARAGASAGLSVRAGETEVRANARHGGCASLSVRAPGVSLDLVTRHRCGCPPPPPPPPPPP
ncbi:hypothetical protein KDA82_35855, partial [Streptomyces daliensis]|nr:hypothetical protein [Streptomyces daliensis]